MVEKVLQIAQLNKSEFSLKKEHLNMHELISKCIKSYELIIKNRNGIIDTQLDANNFIVNFDKTHLINVISNLIDNAIKYSPNDPKIIVSSKNSDNGIEVKIIDHGKGMNKEECKHIFEKFYRVPTGSLHDVKGFGIGLFYVDFILSGHKGFIKVKSELNKGTEMKFWIPIK